MADLVAAVKVIARVCGLTEEQAATSTGHTTAAASPEVNTPRPTAEVVGDVDDDIVVLKSKIS